MAAHLDLRQVPLFTGLTGCDIAALLSTAHRKAAGPGSAFFHEQDDAGHCYLLVSGHVKLVQTGSDGSQVVLRFVGPGELMGWVALLGGTAFPGTAEAISASVALVWDRDAIRQAILDRPVMALNALEALGGRLREAQHRLRELATERVEQRLARALLRLVRQAGQPVAAGIEIPFPLSRQMLAETAGATLYTASRVLAGWSQQGIVGGGRRRMVVLLPDRLRELAEEAGLQD